MADIVDLLVPDAFFVICIGLSLLVLLATFTCGGYSRRSRWDTLSKRERRRIENIERFAGLYRGK